VPNKEFITGRLLNWSLSDPVTRILQIVGVAYGSGVDNPPALVTFDTFGDNALILTLRAFVDSIDMRLATVTELNRAFAEAGVRIAFPQRVLRLDTSSPLRV